MRESIVARDEFGFELVPEANFARVGCGAAEHSRGPAPGVRLDRIEQFDRAYYLEQYPDVRAARIDALTHYLGWGRHEGRRPASWFDPEWYASHYFHGGVDHGAFGGGRQG